MRRLHGGAAAVKFARGATLVYASFVSITSRQHPFVQRCRLLAAGRGEPGTVLLDGPHLIQDALDAGLPFVGAVADDRGAGLLDILRARQIPVYLATTAVVEAASPVRSPSGIVAIARWAPLPANDLLDSETALLVGLVGVQDPGNVGTIIRSADALGATGVVLLDGTADPAGWKALRAAMGSTFRVPIGRSATGPLLAAAHERHIPVVATVATAGIPVETAPLSAPVLVLIGSEGAGLPADVISAAAVRLTIPMRSRVNSLNAATTASVILWELARRARLNTAAAT